MFISNTVFCFCCRCCWASLFFTFVLMQLPADDTVDMMYSLRGGIGTVKQRPRAELGLDRPLLVRYLDWLLAVCSGDMGRSYISGTPVTALL